MTARSATGGGCAALAALVLALAAFASAPAAAQTPDSAPDFGTGSVTNKSYTYGTAITEFQIPAATGGNGDISYRASGLPAGLVFDADGSGSCPGTEPREICGTPSAATSGAQTVTITAADADSNTASSDEDTLTFTVTVTGSPATLASSPSPLTEANLNGATLTVTLPSGVTFAGGPGGIVAASSFALVATPAIPGLSISGFTGGASGATSATLTLATGAGYGFSRPSTLAVRVSAAATTASGALTSAALAVSPTPGVTLSRRSLALQEAPGSTNANRGTYTLVLDSPLTGCTTVLVQLRSDNADVTLDVTNVTFNTTAPNQAWNVPVTFTVTAGQDADGLHDTATISHRIYISDCADYPTSLSLPSLSVTVHDDEAPSASISATNPTTLTEANLNNATVTVALANGATFGSGVTTASFELVTDIPGVSVDSVSSVSSGDTSAVLTLAFTGDFTAVETLAVKVLNAAHTASEDLTTGTVNVTASAGVTVSKSSLVLEEDPGTSNANRGTYTVVLESPFSGCSNVQVQTTSNNPDVTVSPTARTFSGTNPAQGWNVPQTYTVTAAQDTDGIPDAATIGHSVVLGCAGYTTSLAIDDVEVTVNDDEVGVGIATTPAALAESTLHGATVALTLNNTTFAAGAPAAGAGAFELVTTPAIPNLSIAQVSGATSGGTTATLTLGFTGDFRALPTLAVRVPAATHAGSGALTSNAVTVTADAGVTVSRASLSLDEAPGSTNANRGTYTVVLDTPLTGTGCSSISVQPSSDNADVQLFPTNRTFNKISPNQAWNVPVSFTVTAVQDDDGVDDAATISHRVIFTNCADYPTSLSIASVSVAVDDDETPGVVIDSDPSTQAVDTGALALTEGHATDATEDWTVRLATQPTQTVTVTLTSADADAVTIDDTDGDSNNGVQSTLTFTTTNWDTAQTVTARAADDADATNESVTLTATTSTATASEYYSSDMVGRSASLTATVTDDDALTAPGSVTVAAQVRALRIGWGAVTGADGYKVQWKSGQEGYDPAEREGTATGTAHTVDNLAAGTEYTVRVIPTRTGANDGPASAEATGTPLAVPTLAIDSPSVAEGTGATGGTLTFTVDLSHASQHQVTVGYADAGTGTATAGASGAAGADYVTLTAGTLTIAAGDTRRTVDVTVAGDTTDEPDETVRVTLSGPVNATLATATGTGTITDDDATPTVTLALTAATIGESGAANVTTVSAALNRPSSAAMTVTVAASPGAGTDFTLSSAYTLTLAAGATTSTGTVTITATDDDTDSPDKQVTVSGTVTGTAVGGSAVANPVSVTLTITDDDATPTVTLALDPDSISEEGGVSTVTASLNRPSSAVMTVTVGAAAGTGAGAGDFSLSTATTLTLAAGATTSTGAVTVTATGNAVDTDSKEVTVSGTVAAATVGGSAVANPSAQTLTITDDDTAGVVVSPAAATAAATTPLRTTEAGIQGGQATFTVALASEPVGDVVIAVASSDTGEGTVSPSSLTFTASDWNTVQTVTLTGVDDTPTPQNPNPATGARPWTVALTVNQTSTADSNYDALAAVTVHAVNVDDEYGLAVGSVMGQATEAGATATFTVALNTQPTGAVTVTVASRDEGEGRVSTGGGAPAATATLTFSTTNWSTAQTVTVTGQDDAIDDGTETWNVRLTSSSGGSGGDANYHGLVEDVSVTTTDDDATPAVALALSPARIDEGGASNTATVTATLDRASDEATTITVTAMANAYTVASGAGATIVIAAGQTANASDTATLTAVANDTDAPDREVTVTATVANDRAAADGETVAVTGATLTITDDDAAPTATLSLNPASISENGGTSVVSAVLSRPSSAATTVTVTGVSGRSRFLRGRRGGSCSRRGTRRARTR